MTTFAEVYKMNIMYMVKVDVRCMQCIGDHYLTSEYECFGGTPRMASFRLCAWPFHPYLTLRMEKALSEPFRSICSRGGGVRVDFGQRLLLRLPARVFLHLV